MLPITIDISDVLSEFSAIADRGPELSAYILDRIQDEYMFKWENAVNSELKGTRKEYKRAMDVERIDNYNVVFKLMPRESQLAMMIEEGASSFDEKQGFANSPKRHEKEGGGWYLTVPFRMATSEAVAESSIFSQKMPPAVEKIAKSNQGKPVLPDQLPAEYQKIGMNKTSGYKHKTNIYVGLKRNEVGAGRETRGNYMSFRRVSDKTEQGAFIHPGFKAHKLMDKALEETKIDILVDRAIDEFLKQSLG
jgi:hypothetical protein